MPQSTVRIASFAWIALVVAILALCFWINAWPFSALAPWQMRQFGRSFPVSSIVVLAIVPIALGLIMLRIAGSRAPAMAPQVAAPAAEANPVRPITVLFGAATVAALGALGVLLAMTTLPAAGQNPQLLDLNRDFAPSAGPAVVAGARAGAAELRYTVSRFGIPSVERYLPLMGPGAAAPGPVALIVRRADNGLTFDPAALPDRFAGVLVANALPAGVEASFAARGVPLARPYWVLVSDPASLYRPYWTLGGALLAIALVLTVMGSWKLWRLRRGRP
jgi:hypothetical protein